MAQLSNDCFAAGANLMSAAEALDLIESRVPTVAGIEPVALRSAARRILADDLVATFDVPPHDNAAVDGFAFRHADLNSGADTRLDVAGRAAAGHPLKSSVSPGQAVRIFTGAAMPDDLDTVAMQEDCTVAGDAVVIPPGLRAGANRRKAGEDFAAGATVLRAGQRLRPQDVGLAAAAGFSEVAVRRRLRAAVFSTGDEVVEPGAARPPGAIHDSNRYALMGLLEGLACTVSDIGILPDDPARIGAAIENAAASHDLVLTSGGVSVGDEDHVKHAIDGLGSLHFWRLAIRPGRPLAMGQVGDTAFVGIPGNPVAVMVTFLLFVRPLVLRLSGARAETPRRHPVVAEFDYSKKKGRREWLRARLDAGDGLKPPRARRFPRDGAGILSSMVESDGLIELAEDVTRVETGETVPFLPYSEVLG